MTGLRRHDHHMLTSLIACVACLSGAAAVCEAQVGDLDNLFRLREARTRRSSSADPNWQNGNGDARGIAPGKTLTIADLEGPGIIRHIWFTVFAEDWKYGRSLVLRMYWDGADKPAVETPLGDFFAVGHGARTDVTSAMVAVASCGRAYNCYWPMPFRRSARITVTNDSTQHAVRMFFYYVDYETVPSLGDDTAYFHAQYRQEYPAQAGDYLILDAQGRGHYVGTVLSTRITEKKWFGEGDDRFYIDGETEPSLRGTGTEDYFCDAWGYRLLNRPYFGVTLFDGFEAGDRVGTYRWHIPDPVHFSKSLKVTIEHKGPVWRGDKRISGFGERPDLFSSVAFWYQTGKAKRFAELPPVDKRTVPRTTIEMENFATTAKVSVKDTRVHSQFGHWSGTNQLAVKNQSPDAVVTIPFKVDAPIDGLATIVMTKSYGFGIWRVSLDGNVLKGLDRIDLLDVNNHDAPCRLGHITLAAGEHELKLECLGKNSRSSGYSGAVDALVIEDISCYRTPEGKETPSKRE